MSAKLEPFRSEIEAMKASGLSVRKIAEKLSQDLGQPVAASSVHLFLKGNGNGESKSGSEIDSAMLLERLSAAEDLVKQLHERLESVEGRPAESWFPEQHSAQPPRPAHLVERAPYTEESSDEQNEDYDEEHKNQSRRRFRIAGRVLGIVLGLGIPFYMLGPAWKWTSSKPVQPEAKGIRVEVFHTPDGWRAIKWPDGKPSPLTRIKEGYRIKYHGVKTKVVVDDPHGEIEQPILGLLIEDASQVNDKIKPVCQVGIDSLHCGYLYTWLRDSETWGDVAMADQYLLEK